MQRNSITIRRTTRLRAKRKANSKSNSKQDSKTSTATPLSIVAIGISLASLYFQFFFYDHRASASVIYGSIKKDSLHLEQVFHNQGNQDITILGWQIVFYPDENEDNENEYISFSDEGANPYILPPRKQAYFKTGELLKFQELNLDSLNSIDTLRIGITFKFLNDNNLMSETHTKIGWLTLDSLGRTDFWEVSYANTPLKSDRFISKTYRTR